MPQQHSGFSLIELLVVLAIITILCAVAYPNYQAHIIKTRRSQAKVALIDLAARLEQYHLIHHSYKDATLAELNMEDRTENNYYLMEIQTATDNYYAIAAIPENTQTKDQQCGILTYDEKGEKGLTGSGTLAECW